MVRACENIVTAGMYVQSKGWIMLICQSSTDNVVIKKHFDRQFGWHYDSYTCQVHKHLYK